MRLVTVPDRNRYPTIRRWPWLEWSGANNGAGRWFVWTRLYLRLRVSCWRFRNYWTPLVVLQNRNQVRQLPALSEGGPIE